LPHPEWVKSTLYGKHHKPVDDAKGNAEAFLQIIKRYKIKR
jgi:hypothetical protein